MAKIDRLLNKSKRIKVIAKQHGIDEVLVSKKAGIPVNHNAEMYINYAELFFCKKTFWLRFRVVSLLPYFFYRNE